MLLYNINQNDLQFGATLKSNCKCKVELYWDWNWVELYWVELYWDQEGSLHLLWALLAMLIRVARRRAQHWALQFLPGARNEVLSSDWFTSLIKEINISDNIIISYKLSNLYSFYFYPALSVVLLLVLCPSRTVILSCARSLLARLNFRPSE